MFKLIIFLLTLRSCKTTGLKTSESLVLFSQFLHALKQNIIKFANNPGSNTRTGIGAGIHQKSGLLLDLKDADNQTITFTTSPMNNLKLMKEYLTWYFTSSSRHGVHSPFMYDFLDKCLYAGQDSGIFDKIESQRSRLIKNRQIITFKDLGAGSRNSDAIRTDGLTSKSIRQIAKSSLQSPKYTRLMYRIAGYFQCKNILEMGTSFGITTAYLSEAVKKEGTIHTLEGADAIADIARDVFNNLNCTNVTLHRGEFSDILPEIARCCAPWDMVFLDGNHNGPAVLNYFLFLVKHISPEGVLIVDDIRWSSSMWEAWNTIKSHPQVSVTADLFFMGLVFFNPSLSKEHFKVRF